MHMLGRCFTLLAIVAFAGPLSIAAEDDADPLAFRLPATGGESIKYPTADGSGLTAICFLGAECPLAKLYGPRLQTMADEFETQGVRFIGVNSNHQDSMSDVQSYVEQHEIRFPVTKDYDHRVADLFSAKRTPEVFLVDQVGEVLYRGLIDDQYRPGISRPETSQQYLRDAIEQALAGKPVDVPVTDAVGCMIGRVREVEVTCEETYCREIARVLQSHCVECHREGEIGPFASD